ncbi:TetR/AcrR family transcriptional regulator [Nocardia sp. BSTN01]|uniref:TetR/AcrR family transcriptional regulator n=1 Tax=Nocardia sp. BSTN01 TaxID=2783665 RepID=UPI00188DD023|nr:TetR/AcrR family transcriptional regulator [Nocardia sp. BSTN01]MBF4999633.1 TetR/AcrR family transcriptional regulator [Nocardia sp. BSTN01]
MTMSATPYHHGDLPNALVRAAVEILEEGGSAELSLRGAARRAGVSTAAPYRHFADRDALLSAVAAVGYRDLVDHLVAVHPSPVSPAGLGDVAVAYVQFALTRPGMFRVMFTESCDPTDRDRVDAVAAIHDYVESLVREAFPDADPEPTATAMWALVHGLAMLHLDGKFDTSSTEAVAARVRAAVSAVLGLS